MPASRQVSLAEATRFWLKLGFISFGGPAGQIAVMHREIVERRRWIGEQRFLHALNYCMLLPGPEATQLAIYIGWLLHRLPGGLIAGVLFVLPSVFVMLGLSYAYAAFVGVPAIAALFAGVKPVVVAIVVEAVIRIGRRALRRPAQFLIAAGAFGAIYGLRVPFPIIVIVAALLGAIGARLRPDLFSRPVPSGVGSSVSAHETNTDAPAVVLEDGAPSPSHALPSRGRALRTLLLGLALWSAPLAILIAWRGAHGLHARQYAFFTQAALVTFGGAYAVLSYVTQKTVETYGWITHAQAVDGLALAETTPGPLIMVLQFIGFMAAWSHPEGMGRTTSAILGAGLTTWVTFLPCFIFIFIGAPYIEVLRGNRSLGGALSGVTAAVVGVVLNLGLVLGASVVWPHGPASGVDPFAAIVTIAAFSALSLFRAGVPAVVMGGGLAGLLRLLLSP